MTIQNTIDQAVLQLSASTIDAPVLDAQLLLMHCLGCQRTALFAWPDRQLEADIKAQFEALIQRRLQGEPIAYLIQKREFYGLDLKVTEDVLIPRPETEILVDLAVEHLPTNGKLLDLGTGSGAIAVAIAHTRADANVLATDISGNALKVAAVNAKQHKVNIEFIQSDWFNSLPVGHRFDLIISNPPYIDANHPFLTQTDIRHEPQLALTPGEDGLTAIRAIIERSIAYLKPQGWLMLEHGYDQAEAIQTLFKQPQQIKKQWSSICTKTDLANNDRVTLAQFQG